MKMPAAKGIIIVHGDEPMAQGIERGIAPGQKNAHSVRADNKQLMLHDTELDKEITLIPPKIQVLLQEQVRDKYVTIGTKLYPAELMEFLCQNMDVLAWPAQDLGGVSINVVEHAWSQS